MAGSRAEFSISDDKTFDENVGNFAQATQTLDAKLGPILQSHLRKLLDGTSTNVEIWNALLAALVEENKT